MLYLFVILLCCLCLGFMYFKDKDSGEPPQMPGWLPVFGNAYIIMGDSAHMLKSVRRIGEECSKLGGVMLFYLGFRKIYVITDPEDSLTIMNACLKRHEFLDFAKQFLGNGLLTADVPTWKKNRKLLTPAFTQHTVDKFIDVFNTQAQALVEAFTKEVGRPFDQDILLRVNTLETICSTSLGVCESDSEYSNLMKQYIPCLALIIQKINERIQKVWLHYDFIFNMSPEKRELNQYVKRMAALSNTILQKKKKEKRNKEKNKPEKFRAFIDLILDLADETGSFTDEDIKAEIETTIAGAQDTTSTVLTFGLAMLGSYPRVQEKCYEEIKEVVGSSEKSLNKEDLNRLIYTEAILKELLRLFEIIPILPRRTETDVKLKKYSLKANSQYFIATYSLHRSSIWGPDADQFRPERWLDKETLPDPKYFGAFGLGRRSCIGKYYAMLLMKTTLVYIVRKFHIASDVSNLVAKITVLLRPQSGHNITLTLRDN